MSRFSSKKKVKRLKKALTLTTTLKKDSGFHSAWFSSCHSERKYRKYFNFQVTWLNEKDGACTKILTDEVIFKMHPPKTLRDERT